MLTTPWDYYQEKCTNDAFIKDENQLAALAHLQTIYTELLAEHARRQKILAKWQKPKLVKGLYLWGGVGIGKTFLMDCFYHCLPFPQKKRVHFHQFMYWVHQQLKQYQGQKNPLRLIVKQLSKTTSVLCFDEMVVNDIVDAMLLAQLFRELFAHGICLVTTSNIPPDDLYKRGLQRESFLPAIALLKQHTTSFHLQTIDDYRLQHLNKASVFYLKDDTDADLEMEKSFDFLAQGAPVFADPIHIHDRIIPIIKRTADIIWFDFKDICHAPRSQQDYLELSKQYRTIFISNVAHIPSYANNTIRLFIHLVDVLYDAKTRLILLAEVPVHEIYTEGRLKFEYQRTCSRLIEMQSVDY